MVDSALQSGEIDTVTTVNMTDTFFLSFGSLFPHKQLTVSYQPLKFNKPRY